MAIVQISRITQRKGLETDLPQPLAGAELGWAVDQRRLFIGNGELSEGAPVVGNTEILTEFSDILAFTTAYTYQGLAAGYAVQTGATSGTPVTQSLQSRLDSYAVVTDFGAIGDGVTDDTAAINRALFQLYCRQINTQVRRSLFFPAGTYVITDTILIPPYCTLYGEGPNSSIISLQVQAWTSTVSWQSGVLVENSGSYYRSLLEVPAGISIANTTYWASGQSLPTYIARTADSLQQTGANIGTNGAMPPQSITVTGIKFATDQVINGVLIDKCVDSNFSNIQIHGPLTTGDLNTDSDDIAAVRWSSSTSLVCDHVVFNDSCLDGFTYATATAQQTKGCVFTECKFDTLYQGAYVGGAVLTNGGPTGTRVTNSVFDNIYAQGIVIEGAQLNASAYNVFYDVGNHFNGVANPATSIIDIDADQNISIGDMFERSTAYAGTYPRINLNYTASIGYDSAYKIQQGNYTRFTGVRATLPNNTSTTTLFTVDATTTRAFKIDYTITRGTSARTGTYSIVASTDGTGSTLAYDDVMIENASTGVTLTVTETGSTVSFKYATTNTGTAAEIYYSITRLA
jgi:hypothetical protein